MKTRILKSLLTLLLTVMVLPMLGQDFMVIYLKNGDVRKFYMKNITEISASRVDTEGIQHSDYSSQCITTIYDKYVYNLEDVDSITFTKIDEQKAEENFVTAMPEVFTVIEECETIADIEDKIDQIKNTEGVADAWSDGHQLYVTIEEGETFTFHYNHSCEIDELTEESDESIAQIRAMVPKMAECVQNKGKKLKAVIANQQHLDEDRNNNIKEYYYPLLKNFKACDIDVHYVDNPTIDFFFDNCHNPNGLDHLNLYDYDIILLITHGSYGTNYHLIKDEDGYKVEEYDFKMHSFLTSDDLLLIESSSKNADDLKKDKEKLVFYYTNLMRWRNSFSSYRDATDMHINLEFSHEKRNNQWYWICHPSLTEHFFYEIAIGNFTNPNSFFFNTSCQSLKGENGEPSFSFAKSFFNHGLGTYLGFSETDGFGKRSATTLINNMLKNGWSLDKSYKSLSPWMREETIENLKKEYKLTKKQEKEYSEQMEGAKLLYDFNPDNKHLSENLFFFSTHTEKKNKADANKEYNENHTVTLKGEATLTDYNKDNLTIGFIVSYYDNTEHQFIRLAEPDASSSNNKVVFKATLNNLERDISYSYRAFTDDGIHYNYGEAYEFTIDKQEVPPVCPARITNVEFLGAEYHHSAERQNQMPYRVTAALDDMTDIEEWGICYYGTTISEFPFTSVSNEQSKKLTYSTATSNLGKTTTKLKVDFNAYVAELNDEVGVYVKKRDKATGELTTIYGEKFPFTLRYDTKPSLVYSDPTIRETKVIATKNGHKQYQTIVDYNYSAKGTFWMEYSSYVVVGNNWNDLGSAKLYFEKDADGQLNSTEKYWDNIKLGHSAYDVIYLRNSKKTYSNCLNFSGSNGIIDNVWVSSSPAYSARQKESNSGDSEYMNYRIVNTPTEDVNAKQKKVIHQIPYGGGCLEEIAY